MQAVAPETAPKPALPVEKMLSKKVLHASHVPCANLWQLAKFVGCSSTASDERNEGLLAALGPPNGG